MVEIVATFFEVASNMTLILFWLVMVDKIRRVRTTKQKFHLLTHALPF